MIPGILFPSPRTAGLPVQPVQLYGMRVSHTESRPAAAPERAPHALRLPPVPRWSGSVGLEDHRPSEARENVKPGNSPTPNADLRPISGHLRCRAMPHRETPLPPTPSAQRGRRAMATRCRHSTSSARGEEVRCVTARHHTGDIRNQRDSGRESRAGSGVLPPDRAGAPTVRNAGRTRDRRRPVGVPSDHERPARPRRRPG